MIANMIKRISVSMILATCCALAVVEPASAQPYPSRPIKAIVPFPAGGGTDATARVIAEYLSRALGESVIVENRAGADGVRQTGQSRPAGPCGKLWWTRGRISDGDRRR